jgi:hypothetical protein
MKKVWNEKAKWKRIIPQFKLWNYLQYSLPAISTNKEKGFETFFETDSGNTIHLLLRRTLVLFSLMQQKGFETFLRLVNIRLVNLHPRFGVGNMAKIELPV